MIILTGYFGQCSIILENELCFSLIQDTISRNWGKIWAIWENPKIYSFHWQPKTSIPRMCESDILQKIRQIFHILNNFVSLPVEQNLSIHKQIRTTKIQHYMK